MFDVWDRFAPEMKASIKSAFLDLLASNDKTSIKAAAACISAISAIELPRNEWPDLIRIMSENSNNEDANIRLASI